MSAEYSVGDVMTMAKHLTDGTPNWYRESFGDFKAAVHTCDRAPKDAAKMLTAEPVAQGRAVDDLAMQLACEYGETDENGTGYMFSMEQFDNFISAFTSAQPGAVPEGLKELADEVEACWICASNGDGEITLETINNWSGRLSMLAAPSPGESK